MEIIYMRRFCFIVRYCLLFSFFALITGFISAGFYRDFGTQTAGACRFFPPGRTHGGIWLLQIIFAAHALWRTKYLEPELELLLAKEWIKFFCCKRRFRRPDGRWTNNTYGLFPQHHRRIPPPCARNAGLGAYCLQQPSTKGKPLPPAFEIQCFFR